MLSALTRSPWFWPGTAYVATEMAFYVAFHFHMVPRANRIDTCRIIPYRDFGDDRHKLLLRVLQRLERNNPKDTKKEITRFLTEWFHVATTPPSVTSTVADDGSGAGSSDDDEEDDVTEEIFELIEESHNIPKESIDPFFAWAFFGKPFELLDQKEIEELLKIYSILEEKYDVKFLPKSEKDVLRVHEIYRPRCMTLEPVKAMHRPLLVYVMVYILKQFAAMFLSIKGYRRHVASSGLVAWHKPALVAPGSDGTSTLLPMIFFHGIAPGGLVFYLPMILSGLAIEPERPVVLFENKSISCTLDFSALDEQQTVDGVVEILDKLQYRQSDLQLVGHSFGSCPITWLLASKQLPHIRQISLIDPVTILLSEPDVMVNFLYAEELSKIRMVASSELFTEYYLRRHFAWYNSELWLDDIQNHDTDIRVLVCLSERDEIVNAAKVKAEVEHFKHDLIYWGGVGHADCVTSPVKWREIKQAMLRQELDIITKK